MSKRSKACEITPEVRRAVEERDGHRCIFCGRSGRGEAHFIGRAHGGLGVEENILTVCRYCHHELDNGLDRAYYVAKAENYLRDHYPDWDANKLVYIKSEL